MSVEGQPVLYVSLTVTAEGHSFTTSDGEKPLCSPTSKLSAAALGGGGNDLFCTFLFQLTERSSTGGGSNLLCFTYSNQLRGGSLTTSDGVKTLCFSAEHDSTGVGETTCFVCMFLPQS